MLHIAIESKFSQRQRPAPKLDSEQHAHLVTLACSTPPEGRARWTMELLADKLVELKIVDSISDTAVWRELKKRNKAVAEMVHPCQSQRCICCRNGRCA